MSFFPEMDLIKARLKDVLDENNSLREKVSDKQDEIYSLRDRLITRETEQRMLRDEFAMAALSGLIATRKISFDSYEYCVREAFIVADLMLEARKGK